MSGKRKHLQSVGGHYRYRRRWPNAVRSVATSEFFIRHMGTSDLAEAIRLRPAIEIEFNTEVARLARLVDARPRDLSSTEAIVIVSRWFAERVKSDQQHDLMNPVADLDDRVARYNGAQLMGEAVGDMVGSGELEAFTRHTSRLLAEQGIMADESSPGFYQLRQLLARADKERHLLSAARVRGDFGYQPADPVFASALKETPAKASKRTLGALIEAYKKDKADKWSPSSVAAYGPVERVLRDVIGSSRELSTITRDDGRQIFETIKLLPKGLGSLPALRNKSVSEAIRLDLPRLSAKSINSTYLSSMRATFKFAIQEQWMAANPLMGLSVTDQVADSDKRDPFSLEQLNQLFSSEPWSPRDEAPKGKPLHYWGPLMALLLGMRRGEIAQLDVEDVRTIAGVPVILVRTGRRKRLKTANARRMLPIHPELLRMGFLSYVEKRKEQKAVQLWEGERPNTNGQWGDGFSDWFLRLLSAQKITGTKLGLHSFRHNFQDLLREADLHGTAIGQELAGRSKGGDVSNNYGSGFSTAKLAEAISRIVYPELNLPPTS